MGFFKKKAQYYTVDQFFYYLQKKIKKNVNNAQALAILRW